MLQVLSTGGRASSPLLLLLTLAAAGYAALGLVTACGACPMAVLVAASAAPLFFDSSHLLPSRRTTT